MARKKTKILSGLLVNLLPVGLVFVLIIIANRDSLLLKYRLEYGYQPAEHQQIIELYKQSRLYMVEERYDEALTNLEQALAGVEQDATFPQEIRIEILFAKAKAHHELWQHIDAQNTLEKLLPLVEGGRQNNIYRMLREAETIVEGYNSERQKNTTYIASPGAGPASRLEGKVVAIRIFVEDGGGGDWSLRKQDFANRNWQTAKQWLVKQAAKYQRRVSFTERTFIISRNPLIQRLRVGSVDESYLNASEVARLVVQQLGARSIDQFIENIRKQENADQAIMHIQIERDQRSFAHRCRRRCSSDSEYSYIFESARSKRWQSMEYTQAHETLHLFGAADLYNIRNARYYAHRDIMNYPSRFLSASTLEPLTAYAVGIYNKKPETPFPVTKN